MRHRHFVPRMHRSVLEQVFYVVEVTRLNLGVDNGLSAWRAYVALEMFRFYTALERAVRAAKQVEEMTGFSGAEVAAAFEED